MVIPTSTRTPTTILHPDNFDEKESNNGFSWKSGTERNTLGIWFWSVPFIRKLKSTGESVAVLLVDTQGIFDSRLTQNDGNIYIWFKHSTIVASDLQRAKQAAEDHLQHLALFTEYGRATLKLQVKDDSSAKDETAKKSTPKENRTLATMTRRRIRQLIANNHFKLYSFL